MGNCGLSSFPSIANSPDDETNKIRVVTSTGGIMEFHPPLIAERITDQFPGHRIFPHHHLSRPIPNSDFLEGGQVYYLLPVNDSSQLPVSIPTSAAGIPYRMSFDSRLLLGRWRRSGAGLSEAAQQNKKVGGSGGVWRVRLVISPVQLAEILAEESHTEVLIESVRTVAKCGSGTHLAAPATDWDGWSFLSSCRIPSERREM